MSFNKACFRSSIGLIENLKLLAVDIHLEQGVAKNVSKATGVEVAVRSAIVLLVIDLRKLKATILQQLIVIKLLVGQVNL